MRVRIHPGRIGLLLGTALALAPQAATSAQLTHMETQSLTVGTRVFQPEAVAFSSNGVTVRCSEIAFSIAQTIPDCFAMLTEEDVAAIRDMAHLGRIFTTPSGFTFSPSPDGSGIVGVVEGGQSFPVAGNPGSVGSGGGMTEDEVAGFLGLDSASDLGGAAGGIVVGGTAGSTGTTVSVDGTASTSGSQITINSDAVAGGNGGISASVDDDAGFGGDGGISAGVDADASAGGGGGISAGVDADASVGGGGGISAGVDADASAGGGGGISAGVDADASVGGGGGVSADIGADADVGSGGGISADVDADMGSGGISADVNASADVGGVSADVGASADVGSDAGALR